ncbi:MAG: hypothetical protein KDB37_20385 [Ilumatobacter sp.]|nr:hypothetical protein [Ilumatobacter sp.]
MNDSTNTTWDPPNAADEQAPPPWTGYSHIWRPATPGSRPQPVYDADIFARTGTGENGDVWECTVIPIRRVTIPAKPKVDS